MWVPVSDLPDSVRRALHDVGYGRQDIEVVPATTVRPGSVGSEGRRAFVTILNLATGQSRTAYGSWGGPNMFDRDNPVDNDSTTYPLPEVGAVVTGSTGYPRTFARVHVHPAATGRMIPGPVEEVTPQDRQALYCHKAIKGGAYRRDELRRRRVQPETINRLVARGLLARNRAGAVSITTAGRNALGDYRGW